jgi:hypothetical protein
MESRSFHRPAKNDKLPTVLGDSLMLLVDPEQLTNNLLDQLFKPDPIDLNGFCVFQYHNQVMDTGRTF